METAQEKAERYQKMTESTFAKFKQTGTMVPGKHGVVEREIAGDIYRLQLWSVRSSMMQWDKLLRQFGEAVGDGMLGFIRYYTKRVDDDGSQFVHLADVERGEQLMAQALKKFLSAMPPGEGFHSLVTEYFPKVLTRKVKSSKGGPDEWVAVLDLDAQPLEDAERIYLSTTNEDHRLSAEGMPIGFDNYYLRKQNIVFQLLLWILAENIGGFFFDQIKDFFLKAPRGETKNSSTSSKPAS